ncbi:hypothetical protein CYMTET_56183 [Cymbomonas tetramitiformis]|uniref:Uncharacterized protein n=1 Tax=Cymbomonas tetramitiformis TaxID=36881 RepID=A0AAE0BCN4_9CHLO|nr:hypothetical protein CYMTET_56183 [Cymbomonas tetramitiformis]
MAEDGENSDIEIGSFADDLSFLSASKCSGSDDEPEHTDDINSNPPLTVSESSKAFIGETLLARITGSQGKLCADICLRGGSAHLRGRKIHHIEGLSDFVHLKRLDLSCNAIRTIANLETLKSLRFLDLSRNILQRVDGLSTLPVLEELNLSDNSISSFPSALSKNSSLRVLRLARNKLSDLQAFQKLSLLSHLTILSVQGNPVASLEHASSFIMFQLRSIEVLDGEAVTNEGREKAIQRFDVQHNVDLRQDVARLEAKLAGTLEELATTKTALSDNEAREEAAQAKNKELTQKIETLEDELRLKTARTDQISSQLCSAIAEATRLKQELNDLQLDSAFRVPCVETSDVTNAQEKVAADFQSDGTTGESIPQFSPLPAKALEPGSAVDTAEFTFQAMDCDKYSDHKETTLRTREDIHADVQRMFEGLSNQIHRVQVSRSPRSRNPSEEICMWLGQYAVLLQQRMQLGIILQQLNQQHVSNTDKEAIVIRMQTCQQGVEKLETELEHLVEEDYDIRTELRTPLEVLYSEEIQLVMQHRAKLRSPQRDVRPRENTTRSIGVCTPERSATTLRSPTGSPRAPTSWVPPSTGVASHQLHGEEAGTGSSQDEETPTVDGSETVAESSWEVQCGSDCRTQLTWEDEVDSNRTELPRGDVDDVTPEAAQGMIQKCEELQWENEMLRDVMESQREELDGMREELQNQQNISEQASQEVVAAVGPHGETGESLHFQVDLLSKMLESQQREMDSLREELTVAQQHQPHQQQEIPAKVGEVEFLKMELQAERAQHIEVQHRAEAHRKSLSDDAAARETLQQANASQEQEIARLRDEIRNLKASPGLPEGHTQFGCLPSLCKPEGKPGGKGFMPGNPSFGVSESTVARHLRLASESVNNMVGANQAISCFRVQLQHDLQSFTQQANGMRLVHSQVLACLSGLKKSQQQSTAPPASPKAAPREGDWDAAVQVPVRHVAQHTLQGTASNWQCTNEHEQALLDTIIGAQAQRKKMEHTPVWEAGVGSAAHPWQRARSSPSPPQPDALDERALTKWGSDVGSTQCSPESSKGEDSGTDTVNAGQSATMELESVETVLAERMQALVDVQARWQSVSSELAVSILEQEGLKYEVEDLHEKIDLEGRKLTAQRAAEKKLSEAVQARRVELETVESDLAQLTEKKGALEEAVKGMRSAGQPREAHKATCTRGLEESAAVSAEQDGFRSNGLLKADIALLKTEKCDLERSLAEATRRSTDLLAEKQGLEGTLADVRESFKVAGEDRGRLEASLAEAEGQMADLQEAKRGLEERMAELSQRHEDTGKDRQGLEASLTEVQQQIPGLEREKQDLQEQLADSAERQVRDGEERAELKWALSEAESQIKGLVEEKEGLEEALNSITNSYTDAGRELHELEEALSSNTRGMAALAREKEEVEAALGELSRAREDEGQERRKLEDSLVDSRSKVTELKEGKEELSRSLSELKGEKDEMSRSLSELMGEKDELNRSLSELMGEKDELSRSLSEMMGEKEELSRSLSELMGEKDELNQSLSEAASSNSQSAQEKQDLEDALAQMTERLDQLRQEKQSLERALAEAESNTAELRQVKRELQREAAVNAAEIQQNRETIKRAIAQSQADAAELEAAHQMLQDVAKQAACVAVEELRRSKHAAARPAPRLMAEAGDAKTRDDMLANLARQAAWVAVDELRQQSIAGSPPRESCGVQTVRMGRELEEQMEQMATARGEESRARAALEVLNAELNGAQEKLLTARAKLEEGVPKVAGAKAGEVMSKDATVERLPQRLVIMLEQAEAVASSAQQQMQSVQQALDVAARPSSTGPGIAHTVSEDCDAADLRAMLTQMEGLWETAVGRWRHASKAVVAAHRGEAAAAFCAIMPSAGGAALASGTTVASVQTETEAEHEALGEVQRLRSLLVSLEQEKAEAFKRVHAMELLLPFRGGEEEDRPRQSSSEEQEALSQPATDSKLLPLRTQLQAVESERQEVGKMLEQSRLQLVEQTELLAGLQLELKERRCAVQGLQQQLRVPVEATTPEAWAYPPRGGGDTEHTPPLRRQGGGQQRMEAHTARDEEQLPEDNAMQGARADQERTHLQEELDRLKQAIENRKTELRKMQRLASVEEGAQSGMAAELEGAAGKEDLSITKPQCESLPIAAPLPFLHAARLRYLEGDDTSSGSCGLEGASPEESAEHTQQAQRVQAAVSRAEEQLAAVETLEAEVHAELIRRREELQRVQDDHATVEGVLRQAHATLQALQEEKTAVQSDLAEQQREVQAVREERAELARALEYDRAMQHTASQSEAHDVLLRNRESEQAAQAAQAEAEGALRRAQEARQEQEAQEAQIREALHAQQEALHALRSEHAVMEEGLERGKALVKKQERARKAMDVELEQQRVKAQEKIHAMREEEELALDAVQSLSEKLVELREQARKLPGTPGGPGEWGLPLHPRAKAVDRAAPGEAAGLMLGGVVSTPVAQLRHGMITAKAACDAAVERTQFAHTAATRVAQASTQEQQLREDRDQTLDLAMMVNNVADTATTPPAAISEVQEVQALRMASELQQIQASLVEGKQECGLLEERRKVAEEEVAVAEKEVRQLWEEERKMRSELASLSEALLSKRQAMCISVATSGLQSSGGGGSVEPGGGGGGSQEVQSGGAEVAAERSERSKLRAEVGRLKKQQQALGKRLQMLATEEAGLVRDVAQRREEYQKASREIATLEKDLSALQLKWTRTKEALEVDLAHLLHRKSRAKEQLQSMRSECHEWMDDWARDKEAHLQRARRIAEAGAHGSVAAEPQQARGEPGKAHQGLVAQQRAAATQERQSHALLEEEEGKLQSLQQRLQAAQSKLAQSVRAQAEQEAEKAALAREVEALDARRQELQREVTQCETECGARRADMARAGEREAEEMAGLEQTVELLRQRKRTLEEESDAAQHTVDQCEELVRTLRSEVRSLEQQVRELRVETRTLQQARGEAQQERDTVAHEMTQMQLRSGELRAEVERLGSDVQHSQSEAQRMRSEVQNAQMEASKAGAEAARAQGEAEKMEMQLLQLRGEVKATEEKMEELKREAGAAEEAQAELAHAQRAAKGAGAEVEWLQGEAREAEAEVERLRGEARDRRAEVDGLRGEARQAQDEVVRLRGLAKASEVEVERLRALQEELARRLRAEEAREIQKAEAMGDVVKLLEEKSQLQQETGVLLGCISDVRRELEECKQAAQGAQVELSTREAARGVLQGEVAQLETRRTELDAAVAGANARLENVQRACGEAQREETQGQVMLRAVREQCAAAEATLKVLKADAAQALQQEQQCREQARQLQAESAECGEQLVKEEVARDAAVEETQRVTQRRQAVQMDLHRMEERLAEAQQRLVAQEEHCTRLRQWSAAAVSSVGPGEAAGRHSTAAALDAREAEMEECQTRMDAFARELDLVEWAATSSGGDPAAATAPGSNIRWLRESLVTAREVLRAVRAHLEGVRQGGELAERRRQESQSQVEELQRALQQITRDVAQAEAQLKVYRSQEVAQQQQAAARGAEERGDASLQQVQREAPARVQLLLHGVQDCAGKPLSEEELRSLKGISQDMKEEMVQLARSNARLRSAAAESAERLDSTTARIQAELVRLRQAASEGPPNSSPIRSQVDSLEEVLLSLQRSAEVSSATVSNARTQELVQFAEAEAVTRQAPSSRGAAHVQFAEAEAVTRQAPSSREPRTLQFAEAEAVTRQATSSREAHVQFAEAEAIYEEGGEPPREAWTRTQRLGSRVAHLEAATRKIHTKAVRFGEAHEIIGEAAAPSSSLGGGYAAVEQSLRHTTEWCALQAGAVMHGHHVPSPPAQQRLYHHEPRRVHFGAVTDDHGHAEGGPHTGQGQARHFLHGASRSGEDECGTSHAEHIETNAQEASPKANRRVRIKLEDTFNEPSRIGRHGSRADDRSSSAELHRQKLLSDINQKLSELDRRHPDLEKK